LKQCSVSKKEVVIKMENRSHKLWIRAEREKATPLAAPIAGFMDARIEESMNAKIHLKLMLKKTGEILLEDKGTSAGIEVAGNFAVLLK
jgi:hypothetical protein